MPSWFQLSPVAAKRWRRFRAMRRAWVSLWLLAALYAVSLFANALCNDTPVYVRFAGRTYLPLLRFVPEATFLHNGKQTRPDYKALAASPLFRATPGNRIVFPPVPYGPHETLDPSSIPVAPIVTLALRPEPRIATVTLRADLTVVRVNDETAFLGAALAPGASLTALGPLPPALRLALQQRFRNEAAPSCQVVIQRPQAGSARLELFLAAYAPREAAPTTLRATLRDAGQPAAPASVVLGRDGALVGTPAPLWATLPPDLRSNLTALALARFNGPVAPLAFETGGSAYTAEATRPEVQWPYRPVAGHWLGTDSAGRDVGVRLFYGLRTSLTFGLLLVLFSMGLGILFGALQGFYGGAVDLAGQRITEVWSAIPFLYVMILLGAVYGRGFLLLLAVYALFNWIGISYYMRAEFLRLRGASFVEAARTAGLSDRAVMFRHILPNALVPVITFFPFNLVGAIGSLAALDYLGFGLPPPTPSWGELLQQAQQFRWAWWLILYPTLALFIVMLLGVFIGEGVRNAYDPRPESRME